MIKVINPATGKLITELESDSDQSIRDKYQVAKAAQAAWASISIQERVACITKFSELLKFNVDSLALELCLEVGKPINEARGEVFGAAAKCQFFIDESENVLQSETVHIDGTTKEVLSYEALGVVANISAWNYPYLVGINIFVPALICGNAVMYKPSEFSSMVGTRIAKLWIEAGVPKNIFQLVIGEAEAGKSLCDLPLDGYFFTGSYLTGKKIAEVVSSKLVPVGLELGGKDPLYVTNEITDIKQVAESVAEGVFYNNGQSCCSVERVYVHENIYENFLNHFLETTKALEVGDPQDEKTTIGAITRPQHLIVLRGLVDDALEQGAKLEQGGEIIERDGNFFEPTVFTNVNHNMRLMKEETFGPLIGIQKVANDEEAIQLMNDTVYGLTSSVFSSNPARAEGITKLINSGTSYINCCDRVSGYLPWSGREHSGLGSTLSKHGLYAFCNLKAYQIRA
jgi:acyl-CoA reductase-like NAD-dependent aldehyde dehydrogenase